MLSAGSDGQGKPVLDSALQAVSSFSRAMDDGADHIKTRSMLDAIIKEIEDVWARRREEREGNI